MIALQDEYFMKVYHEIVKKSSFWKHYVYELFYVHKFLFMYLSFHKIALYDNRENGMWKSLTFLLSSFQLIEDEA
jgi:hypothetical protein